MKDIKIDVFRVLEAAYETGDTTIYYTAYKFFESRGDLSPPTPESQKYLGYFNKYFSS